jgi:small subunit ribosomal protein S16
VAVKIRLRRVGAKRQPAYRVVIADSRAPRDGRFIEVIGYYNPLSEPSTVVIDSERALYWLRQGAQPSDPLKRMLTNLGIWAAFTGQEPPAAISVPVVASKETAEVTVVEAPEPVAEEPAVVEESEPVETAIAVEEPVAAAEANSVAEPLAEEPAPSVDENA